MDFIFFLLEKVIENSMKLWYDIVGFLYQPEIDINSSIEENLLEFWRIESDSR